MTALVRDYPKLAHDVIELVGGPSNITGIARCATRLRLVLKDTPEGAHDKIQNLPGVITTVEKGGQFQVVIGNRVGEVYEAAIDELGIDPNEQQVEDGDSKPTLMNRIIAMMSAVFAPFIYVLAAAGLIQGALILITAAWPEFESTGTYELFSLMSWAPFTFLPILIAITAAQFFKTNTFIAVAAVGALVAPQMTDIATRVSEGEHITLFGFALSETTYTSTVLPPLFIVWGLSYLERFFRKHLPEVVTQLFTPLLCLIIAVPLTVLIIGPLSNQGAILIADGFNWLVDVAPPVAAAIVGGFWQVIVIFGVHWGVTPMVLANFDEYGSDPFQAFQTAAVIAQVGAAFGVFLKSRSAEMKKIAASASLTGVFGITEPAIYGVTLRLKKPFIVGCAAGAIGAIVVSLFGSLQYVYAGLPGILTIMNAYEPGTNSLMGEVIGCSVAFFGAAIGVYVVGFTDVLSETTTEDADSSSDSDAASAEYHSQLSQMDTVYHISSPVTGTVLALSEVDDPVFAQGTMGEGVAVEPTDNKVYAPFDGTIATVLPSKHAVGIISDDGVEVLVHIGLDTVALKGKPFTSHVKKGQHVEEGDLLVEFDSQSILQAGYSLTTPVIITNTKRFADVVIHPSTRTTHGNELMAVAATSPHQSQLEGAK
ncbi:beta-glucoside-specific PTS transporter subunit IIABC [Corynebacterium sp. YSMAA1_1_D6]|uniref:beta-glucoside-specific PTS transporter subunit IIABC n=1 Tax=unclassified Corynebacterium TaxID=2624378 RepID=UPI0038D1906A